MTAIINSQPTVSGFLRIILICILTSQVRNSQLYKQRSWGSGKWNCVQDTVYTRSRSAFFIHCVWLNILIKRASNTYIKQMVNFPENHRTLKGKWTWLQFSGTSGRTHNVIFSAQAGHWGVFPKDIPKDRMLDKTDHTAFNERAKRGKTQCPLPTGKHVLSLFSFNINRINLILNINILFKNFQIHSHNWFFRGK